MQHCTVETSVCAPRKRRTVSKLARKTLRKCNHCNVDSHVYAARKRRKYLRISVM